MKVYHCLGLMSGTSLDGLDIVYVRFTYPDLSYCILSSETLSYDAYWRSKLSSALSLSGSDLVRLDIDYGNFLGDCLNSFIAREGISDLDFISSHGHTVYHRPDEGYTLQIGNGVCISLVTGIRTVFDFRTQDVLLGGEGAPLVPIGDSLLFSDYSACLNLGGFSNISFASLDGVLAFDICAVNVVLNHLSSNLGFSYDSDGFLARSGVLDLELLSSLNALDYYNRPPPKSLGVEWVHSHIIPLLESSSLAVPDLLCTFVEHISDQISIVLNSNSLDSVLVTGGGAYNTYLLDRLRSKTHSKLEVGDTRLIEFKEALIFGLLGLLRIEGDVNVLGSVTGACRDHSSGIIVG